MAHAKIAITFPARIMMRKDAAGNFGVEACLTNTFSDRAENDKTGANHNGTPSDTIRHVYVHIPFCARICPYCAFYKDLLDRSQTGRFCEAVVAELRQQARRHDLLPNTIYF